MFARKAVFSSIGRATVMVTVAAMALAVVEPSLARAGSAPSAKDLSTDLSTGRSATTGTSGATDFSSRARARARARVYHGGGGAAAAAAFAGIVGTGLAIAAAQNRRAYYDDYNGYYGAPAYYGGPGYYGRGYGYYGGSSEFGGQPYPNY